jgi:lipoprotein-anchoring transpeptidase ErfK/SrfK
LADVKGLILLIKGGFFVRNRLIFIIIGLTVIGIILALILLRPSAVSIDSAAGDKPQFVQALLLEAQGLEGRGDYPGLKALYQKLINDFPNHKDVGMWQENLDELNLEIIFSPIIVPGTSQEYIIQPLDTLTKIAKQFNTTVELLKKSNNLSSDRITPGNKLKIWTGKFSALVDKSQNILMVKSNEEIIKTYIVATGINNSTPVGVFKIVNKLVDPTWFKAGATVPAGSPENILGTRWLGFDMAGYGIHGTIDPASIGRQSTEGCVRMLNAEVEEVYALLPVGTEVTIID